MKMGGKEPDEFLNKTKLQYYSLKEYASKTYMSVTVWTRKPL